MTKSAMVFIGRGCVSLPFATYAHAAMKSDNPPDASEASQQPRGAIKAGEAVSQASTPSCLLPAGRRWKSIVK